MPLVLCLKRHCQTQSNLGFLVCCLPGVLSRYISHLGRGTVVQGGGLGLDWVLHVDFRLLQCRLLERLSFLSHCPCFAKGQWPGLTWPVGARTVASIRLSGPQQSHSVLMAVAQWAVGVRECQSSDFVLLLLYCEVSWAPASPCEV